LTADRALTLRAVAAVRDKNMMLYKKVWKGERKKTKEEQRERRKKVFSSRWKKLDPAGLLICRRHPCYQLPLSPLSFQHDRVHIHYIITIQNGVYLFTDHHSGMIAYKC
jgi:hypothetical protein